MIRNSQSRYLKDSWNDGGSPKFVTLNDIADVVAQEIKDGTTTKPIWCGKGEFEKFCLLPETITLIGAQPGLGKTALVTQLVFEALSKKPELSALIANVEVSPEMLFKRQLSRCAAVDFNKILQGEFEEDEKAKLMEKEAALRTLKVTFDSRPYNVDLIEDHCGENNFDIVVIDYAQRFISQSNVGGDREVVAVMKSARQIANNGAAVIVVSATNRGSNGKPGLASFRDSSELEYGADDAYIMEDSPAEHGKIIRLTHLKARSRCRQDIELAFYGQFQRFDSLQSEEGDLLK